MEFKKQSEVLRNLIEYTTAITGKVSDYTVGSALRSIYDATSIEFEMLYTLMQENTEEGIVAGLMTSFDFEPRPSRRAYGLLTLTFYDPANTSFIIPRGTRFYSSNNQAYSQIYETLVDYQVPRGAQTVSITVYCTQAGSVGNIEKGMLNRAEGSLFNLASVENQEDILTGADEETFEAQQRRFLLFVESRGRGTRKALEYGAYTVDDIDGVYVSEKVGVSYVYCHDKSGNLSDELKQKVIQAEEEYRSAGIELKVLPMVKRNLDMTVTIVAQNIDNMTETMKEGLRKHIRNYLNSFVAGQDFIVADFLQSIMNYDDALIYDCYLTEPTTNLTLGDAELIRAGELTIYFE